MSEQQNLEIVRRGYEAFGRGDLGTLLSLFADDIEWISPGPPDLATAGHRRGKEQVADFFRILNEQFEFLSFEPKTFLADGEHVVVLGTATSRFRPSGAVLPEDDWAHVYTVKNGKVQRFHEYLDTSSVVPHLQGARARA